MELIKSHKKFLVSEQTSILSVIKKINKNGCKICFVENKKKKILGVISDGDIRRFLLTVKSFDKGIKAKDLCNNNFIFSHTEYLSEKLLNKITENKIDIVPIIRNYKLIGLLRTKSLRKNIITSPVLILAGGKGKRLRPKTLYTPKPLLKIGGKSIIDHTLNKLDREGFQNIFISINYLKQKFYKYKNSRLNNNLNINFLEEKKPLGTAGSLFYLKKIDFENILVINGDLYFQEKLKKVIDFHKNKKNDITICARKYTNKIKYGAIELQNNKFVDIKEKPKSNYLINVGIYIINKKLISNLSKPNPIDMTNFIKKNYKKNKKIGVFLFPGLWVDIATNNDLKDINKILIENE